MIWKNSNRPYNNQVWKVFIGEMQVAETLPSSCNITLADTQSPIVDEESTSFKDSENHNELTVSLVYRKLRDT